MTGMSDVPPTQIVVIYVDEFQLKVKTAEKLSTALEFVCRLEPPAFTIASGYVRKNLIDRYSRQLGSDGVTANQDSLRKLMDITSEEGSWFHDEKTLDLLDMIEEETHRLPEDRVKELISTLKESLCEDEGDVQPD